jgi:large subunit ribosomal protein L21
MFAIIKVAGKQHKVQKGDVLLVDKLSDIKEGSKVKIDKVLLRSDGAKTDIGTPYIADASVELTVKQNIKDTKIRVFKKKPKKRFERTQGHRQQYTQVEVTSLK